MIVYMLYEYKYIHLYCYGRYATRSDLCPWPYIINHIINQWCGEEERCYAALLMSIIYGITGFYNHCVLVILTKIQKENPVV